MLILLDSVHTERQCKANSTLINDVSKMRRLLVENFWQFAMALSQSFSVNSTLRYSHIEQECIPVGCVPSAAVAVGGGVCPGVSAQEVSAPVHAGIQPPVKRITDACENITLPQADGNKCKSETFLQCWPWVNVNATVRFLTNHLLAISLSHWNSFSLSLNGP